MSDKTWEQVRDEEMDKLTRIAEQYGECRRFFEQMAETIKVFEQFKQDHKPRNGRNSPHDRKRGKS